MEPIEDMSRVDAYAATRQRVAVWHAAWKPMAAGAAGAAVVALAAYAGASMAIPTFRPKVVEIPVLDVTHAPLEVPSITMKPVTVPDVNVVPKTVEIEIPRFVPAPAPPAPATSMAPDAPRTPVERRYEVSPEWRGATVRGRILRAQPPNGFVLGRAEGDTAFFPAIAGPDGEPEPNPNVLDDISGLIGRLCACRQGPQKMWQCVIVDPRTGAETLIPQRPRGTPL